MHMLFYIIFKKIVLLLIKVFGFGFLYFFKKIVLLLIEVSGFGYSKLSCKNKYPIRIRDHLILQLVSYMRKIVYIMIKSTTISYFN
jgi:hypothetical protein